MAEESELRWWSTGLFLPIPAITLAAVVITAQVACASRPADWSGAIRVEIFEQSGCTADISELPQRPGERIIVQGREGRVAVDYLDAHFRCEQELAGYVKVRNGTVELLVQPVHMNPLSVAKCDCLYNIHMEIAELAAGTYDVTLCRRWDNRHSPNDPVQIGRERTNVK